MLVKELLEMLKGFDDDLHVCIALPSTFCTGKHEVFTLWADRQGVVNVIAGSSACEIDHTLKTETGWKD